MEEESPGDRKPTRRTTFKEIQSEVARLDEKLDRSFAARQGAAMAGKSREEIAAARAEAMHAVDRSFLERAKRGLAAAGFGALEFMRINPGASAVELAKRLNRGASGCGMTMAIYEEAAHGGVVRDVAKDMLIRDILSEFPYGWPGLTLVSPFGTLFDWHRQLTRNIQAIGVGESSLAILRDLAEDHPPERFWKPLLEDDPLINALFDRYWPG